MTLKLISRLLVCSFLLASHLPAVAENWKVDGKLRGELKRASDFEKSEDVSGIACDNSMPLPRLCLAVDDETQGAQIVLLRDGELRAGGFIPLIVAQFGGEPLELDAEGVAFDSGHFYVVGSHGRPRHKDDPAKEAKKKPENDAKAAASRQIFRISLPASAVDMENGEMIGKADITPSSVLATILADQPDLKSFYDKPLDKNGVTIEGIAVRDQQLFIGMRGPVLGTDAIVLSVAEAAVFDGRRAEPELLRLALGKDTSGQPRGVRDLVRYRNGFLVLAGPVNDPPEETPVRAGDYAIYSWDGKGRPDRRVDLDVYGKKFKPEALLPLDGNAGRVRVLLMFDGAEEGFPTPIEIDLNRPATP